MKISASDGNVRSPVPWAKAHALIDHHLRAAGMGWTILRLTGNSKWMAKGLVVQFDDVVAGHHDIDPRFEIERLTGKPPHSFTDFIEDHRKQFCR